MANKGKPSKQVPDQRAEMQAEQNSPGARRTAHRVDRSREMEKGGKGDDSGLDLRNPTGRHPSESAKLPRSKVSR
ncbi:MAG: hypothetical protein ACOY0T_07390 [Myxococcota bacterium]